MKTAFSEVLSELRRKKGLSQRSAAADLGISQALLSHYENNAREPKLEFVVKACNYYEVTADYILGRTRSHDDESSQIIRSASLVLDALERNNTKETELITKLKQTLVHSK